MSHDVTSFHLASSWNKACLPQSCTATISSFVDAKLLKNHPPTPNCWPSTMPPGQLAPEVAGYTSSNGHWQLLGGREAYAMMLQQSCARTKKTQNLCSKWFLRVFEASCLQDIHKKSQPTCNNYRDSQAPKCCNETPRKRNSERQPLEVQFSQDWIIYVHVCIYIYIYVCVHL